MATVPVSSQAAALHRDAVVIDMCSFYFHGYSPVIAAGGVTALNLTVPEALADYEGAIAAVERHHELIAADPARLVHVRRADDIPAAKAAGKVGLIFGFQNSKPIGDRLDRIQTLWERGVRLIQLTYNEPGVFGDGCLVEVDRGLTPLGRQAIREMQQTGIVVDLSHVGPKTALQAVEAAERPVVVSHANPRATAENPRNVSDELIRAVAATGGAVGVCGWGPICWRGGPEPPGVPDLVVHIDYLVNLVGIDHVGIGTDSSASGTGTVAQHVAEVNALYPSVVGAFVERFGNGLEHRYAVSTDKLPHMTEALLQRGYPADGIKKILGGNFLRVFKEVWRDV
ncbi:MAG: membrane dipeptidase [Armatimonadota bacterium]|nr:membrane dipeptidase [Armatimonadota bacterium]